MSGRRRQRAKRQKQTARGKSTTQDNNTVKTMTEPEVPPSHTAIESALSSLQPLRDLSRNWDVDIASCLEEYLQELVGLSSSQLQQVDDAGSSEEQRQQQQGDAMPNFAHAAIILQNSSNVYSRKVEYLHGLVYKALYEFFKSTSANAKEARRKSADASIDDFYDFDPNEDFLLLDDVVPEDFTNTKINLKEDDDDRDALSSSGTPINQSLTRTRLSLGGLSVTRAERSSLGGIASSSHQRALLGTLNNGSLRLVDGLCDVGEDGVLLMPGSQSAPTAMVSISAAGIHENVEGGGRSLFGEDTAGSMDLPPATGGEDYDDHSNDGAGFDMNGDDDDEDHVPPPVMQDGDMMVEVGVAQQATNGAGPRRVTFAETNVKPKRADPWALLDPHSSEGFTSKPLRKGKTYRLPEGITLPPSECVTGASTRRVMNRPRPSTTVVLRTSVAVETLHALLGKREEPPHIPMDGLVFGDEFLYIAKETAKIKAAERRTERKKLVEQQANVPSQAIYDDDDDDDYGGGFDFGGGDDDNDDENDIGNAGMVSLDEAYQMDRSTGCESNLGKTFEELCRAHIQAFAKGAEDFAFNTKLSDRVNQWQSKLAPILEEEERRAAFDIHRYSEDLLESAKQGLQRIKRKSDGSEHATGTVDFETVTKDCTQSDVCRLFLASLSLANSGNIQIKEETATYLFELVSSSVERPMETYRAPSLAEHAA